MRHSLRVIVAASAAALAWGAFAAPKDTVTIGMVLEPPGLDPTTGAAAAIGEITHYNIFEGLTKINGDFTVTPLLAESDRVKVLTPLTGEKSGAIALFSVDGLDPVKLGPWLWDNYKIVNTPIVHPEFSGIRITPNVYTTPQEIDVFTDAVRKAIKGGITA